jgi:hypothetical protein
MIPSHHLLSYFPWCHFVFYLLFSLSDFSIYIYLI